MTDHPDRTRPCPNCKATPGQPCTRLDGTPMPNLTHPSRNPPTPPGATKRRRRPTTTKRHQT